MKTLQTLALFTLVLFVSCSNPNKAKDIDPTIDQKGSYQGNKIGLNEDKEVVVQSEKDADQELRETGWKVYDHEQKLKTDHEGLTRCREELADPRLGGSGTMAEIPEIDDMKETNEIREEMGITPKGELKIVKKEMYKEKLDATRKYREKLEAMSKVISKHKTTCDREYSYARVKAGLPAKRFESKGYFENGRYVQTRAPERTLDDAFKIASQEADSATKRAAEKAAEKATN